jgi:hypothetical protein
LTNLTIPPSVKTIGKHTFGGCRGLLDVTIPASVTSIGKKAFADCRNLKSVVVPKNAIVKEGAFPEGCEVIRE